MKRCLMVATVAAVIALPAAGASAGTPPSPPHVEHWTHCTLDSTLPYPQWDAVRMLLGGGGDTFWITSPDEWAGHYLIQSYRSFVTTDDPSIVPGQQDVRWSDWMSMGKKTGPVVRSGMLECKGYFLEDEGTRWVDSIDVLVR